ncbi:MAG: hypothetical protein QNI95_03285 [Desulfobacterales bacterium]|nr:hypothetical protein [Desulfobacterales bacterium]
MPTKIDTILALLFAAASTAVARNNLHAKKSDRNDQPAQSDLLQALASSEAVHARRFLMYLRGKLSETQDHMHAYFTEMREYIRPQYKALQEAYSDRQVTTKTENMHQFLKVVDTRLHFLEKYLRQGDNTFRDLFVCQICGHITQHEAPQNCPVCNAIQIKFKHID